MIDFSSLCLAWPDGVLILDDNHHVQFANQQATEITGYTDEQWLDTPVTQWLEGTGTSIREEFITAKISYLLQHPNTSLPQWWLSQSGQFVEVQARLTELDLPEQTIKLITFEEYDDPEQSVFFIRKLAQFPNVIPQPLAQIGMDGAIEFSNEYLNDLMLDFGFDDMGQAKVFPAKWQDHAEQCLANERAIEGVEHSVEDQTFRWQFHPVFDQSIPYVLMVGQNITDQIKHQRSLESINRLQAQHIKQKSEYMLAFNAEMQSPLSEVQTHAELLARKSLNDASQLSVRHIRNASKVLSSIVYDSEDRLRLENNTLKMRQRTFNPRKIAAQVLEMLAPTIQAKALRHYLIIDPKISQSFEGDGKRLGQIIRLILNNAIEYTERGAIVLKLTQRVMADRHWLRISVTDSGKGMSEQQKSKLFSTSANFGHSLAFVKQIVHRMGAQIGVHSLENRGSSFYIDLPSTGDETEPPVFESRPNAAMKFSDSMWQGTLTHYLEFADIPIVSETEADIFFGDETPSIHAPMNVYIGCGQPSDSWDFVMPSHTPPRLVFDLLNIALEPANVTSVAELENQDEPSFAAEPLNLNVMLVDDNPNNITVFSDVLTQLGCQVIQAASGEDALSQWFISGGTVQLILLDCKMPGMDGYDTAIRLREENFNGPIIGLTNRRFEDEFDDALRSGMSTCLVKPLDAEEVYNVILDVV